VRPTRQIGCWCWYEQYRVAKWIWCELNVVFIEGVVAKDRYARRRIVGKDECWYMESGECKRTGCKWKTDAFLKARAGARQQLSISLRNLGASSLH
jgi:hypothetical protein